MAWHSKQGKRGLHLATTVLCLVAMATVAWGSLAKHSCTKEKWKETKRGLVKEVGLSVKQRGLVREQLDYLTIIQEHLSFGLGTKVVKTFNGACLGFVTPWHDYGYDVALTFAWKFSHISPVWLQVLRLPDGSYSLEGTTHINQTWMQEVTAGRHVKIDQLKGEEAELQLVLPKTYGQGSKATLENNFGGYVIDVWNRVREGSTQKLVYFIKLFASQLRLEEKHSLTLVPPPALSNASSEVPVMTAKIFQELHPYVDYLVLTTYETVLDEDEVKPRPITPLQWLQEAVVTLDQEMQARHKILMGLNFYGVRFSRGSAETIDGPTFVEDLKEHKSELVWDPEAAEHKAVSTQEENHVTYFPTLMSVQKRVDLARMLSAGLAVWELGQGHEYFYDLL